LRPIEVAPVPATALAEPLTLLEEALRDGEPLPKAFANSLRKAVETEEVEVLAARKEGRIQGVAVLAYRLNVSAGGQFASIEDLYVRPEARRQGVGRALLQTADERCEERGISYIEVQVEEEKAEAFYTALDYDLETGVRVLSRSLTIRERRTNG
jgi:GNAT superfamily N-acetyltransferase